MKLAQEYKKMVDELLVAEDDESVVMTFEIYRAILSIYFVCLGLILLVFLLEARGIMRRLFFGNQKFL